MTLTSREDSISCKEQDRVADLVGAITANAYMLLIILVFIARILEWLEVGRWAGYASALVVLPLIYLFIVGLKSRRRKIYFVWLALMMLFAIFELVVDQILMVDIRGARWSVILYVMFFFGATGGMIGVAAQAGRGWAILTSMVFILMAVLAFVQRGLTGL